MGAVRGVGDLFVTILWECPTCHVGGDTVQYIHPKWRKQDLEMMTTGEPMDHSLEKWHRHQSPDCPGTEDLVVVTDVEEILKLAVKDWWRE